MTWEPKRVSKLRRDHLESLASGEIPAVIIPSFWSSARLSGAMQRIRTQGFGSYATPSLSGLGLIGIAMSDHKDRAAKSKYLAKVPVAREERRALFGPAGDPAEDFVKVLRTAWGDKVEVASEDGRSLSPSIVRGWNQSTEVHIDWAPVDTLNWSMSDIHGQWSTVLHLGTASAGGGLRIYQREYSPECVRYKQKNSWGYHRSVVFDVLSALYRPAPGDLAIIFTRYFHEVEPVEVATPSIIDRVTVSSFVGLKPDGRLVLWG